MPPGAAENPAVLGISTRRDRQVQTFGRSAFKQTKALRPSRTANGRNSVEEDAPRAQSQFSRLQERLAAVAALVLEVSVESTLITV
jgi:hypothetical protein